MRIPSRTQVTTAHRRNLNITDQASRMQAQDKSRNDDRGPTARATSLLRFTGEPRRIAIRRFHRKDISSARDRKACESHTRDHDIFSNLSLEDYMLREKGDTAE